MLSAAEVTGSAPKVAARGVMAAGALAGGGGNGLAGLATKRGEPAVPRRGEAPGGIHMSARGVWPPGSAVLALAPGTGLVLRGLLPGG